MQRYERAAQIWSLLCLAATNRQVLTYELVGQLIGVPHFGLSGLLEPIQSYCILNNLPPLTALVVNNSGMPGAGFIAAADVPAAQQQVFQHDWLEEHTPTPAELLAAAQQHPSCGIPEAANGPVQ
jgi:hypothetical protein